MTQEREEKERHSDESDRASDIEQAFTADAIRTAQMKTAQAQQPDERGNYLVLDCTECDEPIGEGRLRAAAKNLHCIYCARLAERSRR